MSRRIAAGWDGGGTKTRVCLADESGKELAVSDFGPLNLNGAPEEAVRETVKQAVAFMRSAEKEGAVCASLVIGTAGVSSQYAVEFLEREVRACGYGDSLRIVGDQEIALEGALSGHGAVLIAGTGSVLCGRTEDGRIFRTGGYGYLIDDPGSGYAIGRDILTAVVRAMDGRSEETCLKELVFSHLAVRDIHELITWLYAPQTGKREVASLARLLPEAIRKGDQAAGAIEKKAAADLAELVLAGWRKNGMKDGELALSGAILEHFSGIRKRLEEQVHAAFPAVRIGFPASDPAHGAAAMACDMLKKQ